MTQYEAEFSMSKIINSKDKIDGVEYSIEENIALGMWIYRLSLHTEKLKAYIIFNKIIKKQLYFLKSNEDTNDYSYNVYYDIIEIFEICTKCDNQYSSIKQLCQLLNIKIQYEINQLEKYKNNLKILQQDYLIKRNYLILYKCLMSHTQLLQVINMEGNEHINDSSSSYSGENIVSFSNEFIGNKDVNKGSSGIAIKCRKGTVNPKITLFCLRGLLVKVPFKDMPKSLKFRPAGCKKEKNSYIVPLYSDEVLEETERRVIRLNEAKMKPTRIKQERVAELFGEVLYRSIFGNYYNVWA